MANPQGEVWHRQSAEDVLARLASSSIGLSSREAASRLVANGPNALKEGKRIGPLQIFLGQFKSLIIWILIVAGAISGLLGELVDAVAILAIVVLNAVIGFVQEFKAEKSIAALKKMTAPQAKVRRDGKHGRTELFEIRRAGSILESQMHQVSAKGALDAPIRRTDFPADTAVSAREASCYSLASSWIAWHAFCSDSATASESICTGVSAVD